MSSIDLIVIRGLGDRQGDDIEDRLICSVPVALARGRNELDASSGLQSISISSMLRVGVKPGMLVELQDSLYGTTWRGKVTSARHVVAEAEALSYFELKRLP